QIPDCDLKTYAIQLIASKLDTMLTKKGERFSEDFRARYLETLAITLPEGFGNVPGTLHGTLAEGSRNVPGTLQGTLAEQDRDRDRDKNREKKQEGECEGEAEITAPPAAVILKPVPPSEPPGKEIPRAGETCTLPRTDGPTCSRSQENHPGQEKEKPPGGNHSAPGEKTPGGQRNQHCGKKPDQILSDSTSLEELGVFLHWVKATGLDPAETKLTPKRRTLIREALKHSTKEEVFEALEGWGFSSWHQGKNPEGQDGKGKIIARLSSILGSRDQIEFLISKARENSRKSRKPAPCRRCGDPPEKPSGMLKIPVFSSNGSPPASAICFCDCPTGQKLARGSGGPKFRALCFAEIWERWRHDLGSVPVGKTATQGELRQWMDELAKEHQKPKGA
ncbi:MAG: hypothetical protein KJ927_05480, partial [Candidatus Eisenbacteria bacterium]|nr:hypothetical protein [Candidatus Eisenbacteria bacterium]